MSRRPPASTFQELILRLQEFWSDFGCLIGQPFDVEKGAGTYNMHTFLRALGPEPWKVAYVEPSRRPADGRYGDNPNRLYRHHQFQVVLKPNPPDVQRIYLESMAAVGIHPDEHDIRFVEDNWESPTLGAWGLGWEVWVDGMELTQFTYFQQCGGLECRPVSAELTYGLERIAMYLQNVDNVFDVVYAPGVKYREVFHRDEYEYSKFTFEELNVEMYLQIYELCEKETQRLVEKKLVVPAYDHLMKAAHAFNSLDARGAISVTERQGYILRIRDLAKLCAEGYLELRSSLHFPLMAGGGTEDMSPRELEPVESTPRGAPHRAELFLEVGSEELPAGEVMNAVEHVRNKLVAGLKELGLSHGEPRIFATPRRIAVVIPDVPDRQEDRTVEHSGPPTKSGDTAAAKFAEKVGLKLDQLQKRETKKGEYWFAQVSEKGKATLSLLADIMRNAIATIEFKRSMRWANETETYSRPIRWIAALFDNRCVPFTYAGITADRISKGHRFLAPHDFKIESAAQYEAELTKRKVVADPVRRREMIVEGARKLAAKAGGKLHQDDALLDQIAQLVENPVPLLNHFDEKYLEIPDEVLISEMQHHQRYLPIVDAKGKLMPNFVVVANTTVADEKVSLDGYRRVLTARFEDGAFFFKEDQKKPLASRIDDLKKIRFHRDLGTIHEKVERTVDLAEALAKSVGEKTDESLKRAGWLMKADLTTHMVFEFPELQGVIGAEYARRGGEPEEIAAAIEEHYLPRGAEDRLPQGKLGALLGIADRFDSIAGIFSVGKGPTGSADPFGLRRASLGIIAILRQRGWHLPLEEAIGASLDRIGKKMKKDRSAVMVEISDFLRTRLKGVATGEGVPTDVAEAVLAAGYDDAIDVLARGQALAGLKKSPDFEPIAVTFKRVANILKQAGNVPAGSPAVDPAEKKLQDAIAKVSGTVQASMKNRDYVAAFSAIAQLRPTVAEFFDAVMVMDEDPTVRARRIGLVAAVQKLFAPLADFTKLS